MGNTNLQSPKYHVALSYAGEDRAYVEEVAGLLRSRGISVFYDKYEEATLWGKNLYVHLRDVYQNQAAFTILFLSENYARKLWTNHERESAQARAFGESREYILPARFDDSEIPGVLATTGYVDLRRKKPAELADLIEAKLRENGLLVTHQTSEEEKRQLTEIAKKYPLLAICLQEEGIPIAVEAALPSSGIPKEDLAAFWLLLAKHSEGWKRFGVASAALKLIDELDIGYDAIEYCLTGDLLDKQQKESLALDMQHVTSEKAVVWCHRQLTQTIRSDTYYHSFLHRHIYVIFDKCYQEMLAYLLFPNRGPTFYNIDSILEVSKHADSPEPFLTRWREWIRDGWFDGPLSGRPEEEYETAEILYKIFNEIITEKIEKLMVMIPVGIDHVNALFKSYRVAEMVRAMYHFVAMLEAEFLQAEIVLEQVVDRSPTNLYQLPKDYRIFLTKLRKAFYLLAQLQRRPDAKLKDEFEELLQEIARTDKTGFFDDPSE